MIIDSLQNEFWFHVSNQDEIPIFGIVDKSLDIDLLTEIVKNLPSGNHDDKSNYIQNVIKDNTNSIDLLRTLVGVSDKRMYLELSYIFAKSKYTSTDKKNILGKTLYELDKHPLNYFKRLISSSDSLKSDKSAEIIAKYLVDKQLIEILEVFAQIEREEIETIIEKLILPKEIQQAEAKRRGHGAEHSLAVVLHLLGVSIIPKDRHINPMASNDPNVDKTSFQITAKNKGKTWSFDLIVEDYLEKPLVFLQGLIHTSDPGQYGVNKSDETVQIKQDLSVFNSENNESKELWGLVDGVGFSENKKDTIDKMLHEFDCFIQLKSLYKAGLRLHQLELVEIKAIRFDMNFYNSKDIENMFKKYGSADIQIINKPNSKYKEIKAGKAWLYI